MLPMWLLRMCHWIGMTNLSDRQIDSYAAYLNAINHEVKIKIPFTSKPKVTAYVNNITITIVFPVKLLDISNKPVDILAH